MSRVRVHGFTISLDGYGAGAEQSLEHPLGKGGQMLHGWLVGTRTFHREVLHQEGGATGPEDDLAQRSFENLGAWIMGRHMFAPASGPWPDEAWRGWWGANPPYHVPVFVLTHHARAPLEMQGGTTFHFVTDGPDAALRRARAAAGDRDVRVGGGVSTIRHYLNAGVIDEMHMALSPVLLGKGESLFTGMDLPALGYRVARQTPTEQALHVVLKRG
jgi:dihydrofolate reductase